MTRVRRKLLFGVLLVPVVAVGLLLWQREGLLQQVVRPALVRAMAAATGAEVRLERLDLGWGRLTLVGLHLEHPEKLRLDLERGEATWTFASFMKRRLVTLELVGPHLTLKKSTQTEEPSPLPPGSGFPFDYLRITQGRLALPLGPGRLELAELALELADGAPPSLQLQTRVGSEAVPLELVGTLAWNQGFELILEGLVWDGAERLALPLSLTLERDRQWRGEGALQVEALEGPILERWLRALGGEGLWPAELALELQGLRLEANATPEQFAVRLNLAVGSVTAATWTLPAEGVELYLGGSPDDWQGELTGRLAGRMPLNLQARGQAEDLEVRGRLEHLGARAGAGATLRARAARDGAGLWQGELRLDRLRRAELDGVARAFAVAAALPRALDFELRDPRLTWLRGETGEDLLELGVPTAMVRGAGWRLPLSGVELSVRHADAAWAGEGSGRLAGAAAKLAGRYEGGAGQGSLSLVGLRAAPWLRELGLGDWPLAGGFELNAEGRLAAGDTSVELDLRGRPQRPQPPGAVVDLGVAALQGRIRWLQDSVVAEGALAVDGHPLLEAAGSPRRVQLTLLPSRPQDLKRLLPGAGQLEDGRGLQADVLLERTAAGWQALAGGRAAILRRAPLTLEDLEWSARLHTSAQGQRLQDGRMRGRLQTPYGPVAELSLEAEGDLAGDDYSLRLPGIELAGMELLTADGLSGLTGGRVQGSGTITGRRGERELELDLGLQGCLRELLVGAFYGDFTGVQAQLQLAGRFDPAAGRLQARRLDLRLGELLRGELQGTIAPAAGELAGHLELPRLAALEPQVLPALAAAYPALAGLELEGGLYLEGGGSWGAAGRQVRGTIRPRQLGLHLPGARLDIAGLEGELPLDLGPAATAPADTPLAGALTLERLQAGPLHLPAGPLALRVGRNQLRFDTPLVFGLAGGELRLDELALGRSAAGPELAGRVRIGEVDLERLTAELKLPPMQGRLSANLGTLSYVDDQLSAAGTAGINVFGGGILVRNIRLQSPFSSYRTLAADIDFEAIDLSELTRTLEFGEMNGIADGYIHGLRLFGVTPSAFRASFVTRLEGRRNISVKALRNLSVLSQGGLQAALSRGIYRFIDFYRYRRIGFDSSLENDLFRLRGTAREGSDRYLVHGGLLPPKIDIVAPSSSISFKEMVNRLGRLDRGSGP